jgi:hypothetical protein
MQKRILQGCAVAAFACLLSTKVIAAEGELSVNATGALQSLTNAAGNVYLTVQPSPVMPKEWASASAPWTPGSTTTIKWDSVNNATTPIGQLKTQLGNKPKVGWVFKATDMLQMPNSSTGGISSSICNLLPAQYTSAAPYKLKAEDLNSTMAKLLWKLTQASQVTMTKSNTCTVQ